MLLHGYGSHEGDLFGMSPGLPLGPVVASVRAPIAENGGFAWWSLAGKPSLDADPAEVDAAALAVLDWLDTLDVPSVSLLGFSQGAAMTLQLLRHAPRRFTATVALSGFVVGSSHAGDAALAEARPPVFWGRGTADPIIPDAAVNLTNAWLPAHSTSTIRIYEGLGHSIAPQELKDLSTFLHEHSA